MHIENYINFFFRCPLKTVFALQGGGVLTCELTVFIKKNIFLMLIFDYFQVFKNGMNYLGFFSRMGGGGTVFAFFILFDVFPIVAR